MELHDAVEEAGRLVRRVSSGEVELDEVSHSPLYHLLLAHLQAGQRARATEIARAMVAFDGEMLFDDEQPEE